MATLQRLALTSQGSLVLTGTDPSPQRAFFRSDRTNNYVSFVGNVTINTPGFLDLSNGVSGSPFHLGGNFANNASINALEEIGSTITFDGTGSQAINTAGFTEDFAYITLSKPSGDLTLNAPINVRGTFIMTTGRLMTTSTNILTLLNGAGYSGASDNSFVHGPMINIGPDVRSCNSRSAKAHDPSVPGFP
ncbi:MAG: hypothetical protein IPP33_02045 [Flavobacteriales bacterium]|nr:hypothetical protein [Flavobacteriales bacterium]